MALPDVGRVLRVAQGRGVLVFWKVVGAVLVAAGVATYGAHPFAPNNITAQPALVVVGVLAVAYVKFVYPAVTWLALEETGFVLRTLPGRRLVPWSGVGRLELVSALTPAGRGGNLGGVRVRDREDRLILIVPDVFEAKGERLLALLERGRTRHSEPRETHTVA